ncbi:hypothetical protein [Flavobacterium eburneipallidum]|uniref:hypothetical protein n=1 Tax=Flavobacterium eburneipallidum TaxID=3003263 RepID=UPI002482D3C4|nr:hypothetical protein [Flavobacterium eburneipallidum]
MEENKNSLISVNNSLHKIEKQIAIGDKLLGKSIFSNNRLKIKILLLKYSKIDNFSIKLLSHFYLFNLITIEKNLNNLDWIYLSSNKNIIWNDEMIEKFCNHLNWGRNYVHYDYSDRNEKGFIMDYSLRTNSFSSNSKVIWTLQSVEKYKDKIHWDAFAGNARIPWTDNIRDKYKLVSLYLSGNPFLPWSETFLKKEKLWAIYTSRNSSIPWTVELIKNIDKVEFRGILENEGIKWSENIFWQILKICQERGKNDLNKKNLELEWRSISINKSFTWTEKFIEDNEMKLSWGSHWSETQGGLSRNEGLPWTKAFIEKYYDRWNWIFLSKNSKLPWSEDFIINYIENWDWDKLSENTGLPWSIEFIELYIEKWNWKKLSKNPNLPWSVEFFEKYSNKWDFNILLFNSAFFEIFKPYLNDDLVNEIFLEIKTKKNTRLIK